KVSIVPHTEPATHYQPAPTGLPSTIIMLRYALDTEINPAQRIHCLDFSADGNYLAVGVPDGVNVYRTETGRLYVRVYTLTPVLSVRWCMRGNLLCGCKSGHLAIITIDKKAKASNFLRLK